MYIDLMVFNYVAIKLELQEPKQGLYNKSSNLVDLFCNMPVVICKLDLVFYFKSNCKFCFNMRNKYMN